MPEFKTEPLVVPSISGLLPEGERNRRVALTSFATSRERAKVPTREVVCYECGGRCEVPAAALSAACPRCHAHLNMADVELKPGLKRTTIRTLGDVTVPSDIVVSHLSIICRNLTVYGVATGSFQCSGKLKVRGTLNEDGKFGAATLHVKKGGHVTFAHIAEVGSAIINGLVEGNLSSPGEIEIRRNGELRGNCRCAKLTIDPGGSHTGQFTRYKGTY